MRETTPPVADRAGYGKRGHRTYAYFVPPTRAELTLGAKDRICPSKTDFTSCDQKPKRRLTRQSRSRLAGRSSSANKGSCTRCAGSHSISPGHVQRSSLPAIYAPVSPPASASCDHGSRQRLRGAGIVFHPVFHDARRCVGCR